MSPSDTVGKINQRAYNTADKISWTCIAIDGDKRDWHKDDIFTYDESGSRSVYVSAEDYLLDKFVEITLYNFRMEPIHTETFKGNPKIIFNITKELSKKLVKGIYYCSLSVFNEDVSLPIFSSKDCTLLVK